MGKMSKDRNTFFQDPSELIFEGWIFHFEFFDEMFRVNRIIVLAPPASRDLGQCGTDSFSIRVIMQGQHYFPSSLLVTGLLPLLSIFYEMTSPQKFDYFGLLCQTFIVSKYLSWQFKSSTNFFL